MRHEPILRQALHHLFVEVADIEAVEELCGGGLRHHLQRTLQGVPSVAVLEVYGVRRRFNAPCRQLLPEHIGEEDRVRVDLHGPIVPGRSAMLPDLPPSSEEVPRVVLRGRHRPADGRGPDDAARAIAEDHLALGVQIVLAAPEDAGAGREMSADKLRLVARHERHHVTVQGRRPRRGLPRYNRRRTVAEHLASPGHEVGVGVPRRRRVRGTEGARGQAGGPSAVLLEAGGVLAATALAAAVLCVRLCACCLSRSA
mmetsp:Transcript_26423/g.76180  ORF Transcript_26423/g.76180 Transcript_26423/m.76180 type:complete len:256 (-) Transcript_26423:341-1108(-)